MKCSHPGCAEIANKKALSEEGRKWCNSHRNWSAVQEDEAGEWFNDEKDHKMQDHGFDFRPRPIAKKREMPNPVKVSTRKKEIPRGTKAQKNVKVEDDEEIMSENSVVRSVDSDEGEE